MHNAVEGGMHLYFDTHICLLYDVVAVGVSFCIAIAPMKYDMFDIKVKQDERN